MTSYGLHVISRSADVKLGEVYTVCTWQELVHGRSKVVENVQYFNHWGNLITNDARCTRWKWSPGLPWRKQHSTRKSPFTSKLCLNLRKKLVKCCNWNAAVCGAESWILREISEIPGKFWNVMLEKDGDQLAWSCEKWSITINQGRKKHPTLHQKKEGKLEWSYIV